MSQTDSASYIRSTVSEFEDRIATLGDELRLLRDAVVALKGVVEGGPAEAGPAQECPEDEEQPKEAEGGRMLKGEEVATEATAILYFNGGWMTISQIWTELLAKGLRYTTKDAARTILQYHIEKGSCPVVKAKDERTKTVVFRYVGGRDRLRGKRNRPRRLRGR